MAKNKKPKNSFLGVDVSTIHKQAGVKPANKGNKGKGKGGSKGTTTKSYSGGSQYSIKQDTKTQAIRKTQKAKNQKQHDQRVAQQKQQAHKQATDYRSRYEADDSRVARSGSQYSVANSYNKSISRSYAKQRESERQKRTEENKANRQRTQNYYADHRNSNARLDKVANTIDTNKPEDRATKRVKDLTEGTLKSVAGGHLTTLTHQNDRNSYDLERERIEKLHKNNKITDKQYKDRMKYLDERENWITRNENGEKVKVRNIGEEKAINLQKKGDEQTQRGMKELKGLNKIAAEAYTSGVGMATDYIVGGPTGSLLGMASRTYGNSINEVRELVKNGTITQAEAEKYSALQAAKEVGSELIFKGAGLAAGYAGAGKATEKLSLMTKRGIDKATQRISNQSLKNVLSAGLRLAQGATEEAAEELVGGVLEPVVTNVSYANRLDKEYRESLGKNATNVSTQRDKLTKYGLSREQATKLFVDDIGSDNYIEDLAEQYMADGMSKKAAYKAAKNMQGYLIAELKGDKESFQKYEDKLADGIKAKFSLSDTLEAMASAGLMAGVTGGAGAVRTNVKGADVKAFYGMVNGKEHAAESITKVAMGVSDKEMASRAKAMNEHALKGHELSNTQYAELQGAIEHQFNENASKIKSAMNVARKQAKREGYFELSVPQKKTIEKSESVRVRTESIINNFEKENDKEIEDGVQLAEQIAAFECGYPSVELVEYLTDVHPENRAVFEEATGIELPADNGEMRDVVYKAAINNYLDSAKTETIDRIDLETGNQDVQFANSYGGEGQQLYHSLTDNLGIADADKNIKYRTAFDRLYHAGLDGASFNAAMEYARDVHNLDMTDAREIYNAGIKDRNSNSSTVVYEVSDPTKIRNSEREVFLAFARTFNTNLVITDDITVSDGKNLDGQKSVESESAAQVNGMYDRGSNSIYINLNDDVSKPVGYTIMHELSHSLEKRFPEEYKSFANLYKNRWIEKNGQKSFDSAIKSKINAYNNSGIELSEFDALTEIIADQMGEILHDEEFVQNLAEENPSIARAILESIRDIIRKIRQMFADFGGFRSEYNEATLSQLDLLKEAESLLLEAVRQAEDARTDAILNGDSNTNIEWLSNETETKDMLNSIKHNQVDFGAGARILGKIPNIITELFDVGALDVVIVPKHAYESLNTKEQAIKDGRYEKRGKQHFHNITVDEYYNDLKSIENPIAIYDGWDKGGKKGRPRINLKLQSGKLATIEFYGNRLVYGSNERRNHAVITIFEKNNPEEYFSRMSDKALYRKSSDATEVPRGYSPDNMNTPELNERLAQFNERLNTYKKNRNINYSIPDTTSQQVAADEAYRNAVNNGDMRKAQQMVDEAAQKSGYKELRYHETKPENDIHVFTTDNAANASGDPSTPYGIFTKRTDAPIGLGGKQMKLWVKAENTFKVKDRDSISKALPEEYSNFISKIEGLVGKYSDRLDNLEDEFFIALDEWFDAQEDGDSLRKTWDVTKSLSEQDFADRIPDEIIGAEENCNRLMEEWKQEEENLITDSKEWMTSWLRNNGYDSMELAIDAGSGGRSTDALIVLDANQVKSADPVTYDDNGDVIPLNERFDNTTPDIRFSIDSQGNELSPQQSEYFKDSKVRDEDGNLIPVYHGTNNVGFTEFKRTNNFYTDSKDVASTYTGAGGVYEGYLNITNPLVIDCNNERWSKIEFEQIDPKVAELFAEYGGDTFEEDDAERTSTADIVSVVEDGIDDGVLDYDGIILKNIYDEGMYGEYESDSLLANDYITFNSNQFKNRNNLEPTESPDIRFSVGGYDGRSMSNRAREAYAQGEKPISKWTKSTILEEIEENYGEVDIDALGKLTKDELIDNFLEYSSWHHTGSLYNVTTFYKLKEGADLSLENIQNIIDSRKPREVNSVSEDEKRTQLEVKSVSDDVYNKLNVVFNSGVSKLKTVNGLYNRWDKGANIEEMYAEAIEHIKAIDAPKVDNWRNLPEDHHRQEDVKLFDNDIDAYAQKVYGSEVNRKGKLYQNIKNKVSELTKSRISFSIDSEGNKLTPEQEEFFKDSKIRDKDGNLMLMYHGTEADFNIFDFEFGGQNGNAEGYGFYFTNNKEIANSYGGNVLPVYLNVENPASSEKKTLTRSKVKKLIKAVAKYEANKEDYDLKDSFVSNYVDTYSQSFDSAVNEMVKVVFESNDNDKDIIHEIMNGSSVYSYDEAREFYNVLTDSIGIDGLTTNWKGSDGSSSDVVVAFNPDQIKRADNSNPTSSPDIRFSLPPKPLPPLSEVIPSREEMIKISLDNPVEGYEDIESMPNARGGKNKVISELTAEYEEIVRDNASLTKGRILDRKSIKKQVSELIKDATADTTYNSKERREMTEFLLDTAEQVWKIVGKERPIKIKKSDPNSIENMNKMVTLIYNAADYVIGNAQFINSDMLSEIVELRAYFKSHNVGVSDKARNELADDWNTIRRRNIGNVNFVRAESEGATNIADLLYEEFSEFGRGSSQIIAMYGDEVIDAIEIGDEAELVRIVDDMFQNFSPIDDAFKSEYADDMRAAFTQDFTRIILDEGEAWESRLDRFKDRYDQRIKDMRERQKEALRDVKSKYEEKLQAEKAVSRQKVADVKTKERAKADERVQREKEKSDQKVAKVKERGEERLQKEKDKNKAKEQKKKDNEHYKKTWDKINENYKWLSEKLVKPRKEFNKHIPIEFIESVANILELFDMQSKGSYDREMRTSVTANTTVALQDLRDKISEYSSGANAVFDKNEWMDNTLKYLVKETKGKPLRELDIDTLEKVSDVLQSVRHMVTTTNKLFAEGQKIEIAEQGEGQIAHNLEKIKKYGRSYDWTGMLGKLKHLLNESMMTPKDFFDSIGGPLKERYKKLRRAEDEYIRKQAFYRRFLGETLGKFYKNGKPGSSIEDWRSAKHTETIELSDGSQIKMTISQIMSLYCLSKRKQGLQHILGSGIVIEDLAMDGKVKNAIGRKIETSASGHKVTYNDVVKITNILNEEKYKDARAIADSIQELMNTKIAEWGNKTSAEMWGVEIFKEQHYFPITVEFSEIATEVGKSNERGGNRITSFGMLKPLDENANCKVVIDDFFYIVADHFDKMAKFASYGPAIRDFNRVYNYKQRNEDGTTGYSVKGSLKEAYGSGCCDFIDNFLDDVNGHTSIRRDGVADILNKAIANYKKAAIGMNIRVGAQQPTAIMRSLYILNPTDFTPDCFTHLLEGKKEMHEHCPIAAWKAWGNYQNDYTRGLEDVMFNKDWSPWEVISMGTYGFLDDMTWTVMWNACKNRVHKDNPNVKVGSEEYWNLCNELASDVFDETQVVDSVFHRSDAMRSDQGHVRLAVSFMAEPTRTYNMIRSSTVKAFRMYKDGDKSGAAKELAKMTYVIALNAVTVSAVAAVVDAFRGKGDDDKDKEFWKLWVDNLENNLNYNAPENPVFIPFAVAKSMLSYVGSNVAYFKNIVGFFEDGFATTDMSFEGWYKLAMGITKDLPKALNGEMSYNEFFTGRFASGIGYLTGLPIGTVIRDLKALDKHAGTNVFAGDGSDKNKDKFEVKSSIFDADKNHLNIEDGSMLDNILNKIGINLTKEEKEERAYKKELESIRSSVKGLSGKEKQEAINDKVSYGYTKCVDEGDYSTIYKMKQLIADAGGDVEAFEEKVAKRTASQYKKTIGVAEDAEKQQKMRDYLLAHGWTDFKISAEIVYKSNAAREFKKACRELDEDKAVETLTPLIQAGLTQGDAYKLWENRYRGSYDTYSSGKFISPTSGPIMDTFGYRSAPTAGASTYHEGIDIGASRGSVVSAADGGKIVHAGWSGGFGNQVIIVHDDGTTTFYSHLDNISVKKGQRVSQKQYIGNVGSTGVSTGPHLDFRIKNPAGQFVDPLKYIKQA